MFFVRRFCKLDWSQFIHPWTVSDLAYDLIHKLDGYNGTTLLWQKELVPQKLLIHGVPVGHIGVDSVSETHPAK